MNDGHREAADPIADRLSCVDWTRVTDQLVTRGYGLLPHLLSTARCERIAALYEDATAFRRRVIMQRHAYGRGEYQYFCYPLPDVISGLRNALYRHLAPVANAWYEALRLEPRFPATHAEFLARCHAAGQSRATPLLLSYGVEDYNRLHQDLYGEHVFPIQATVLLSDPAREFSGGEFVLTEQRPRTQSRVEVVPLRQGDAVLFAVRERPESGPRGYRRVTMRHGVSRVRSGRRRALGIIFHDAT